MRNVIKSPKITVNDESALINSKISDMRLINDDGGDTLVRAVDMNNRIKILEQSHQEEIEQVKQKYTNYYETQIRNIEDERMGFLKKSAEVAEKETEKAKKLGEKYLEETEKLCEENLFKATEDGKKIGYNEGMEKATAENQMVLFQLKNVIDGIGNAQKDVLEKYETEIIDFAVDLASKIIATEIKSNNATVINLVADTIKKLKDFKRVTVYLAGFNVSVSTLVSELVAKRLVEYEEYITVEFLDNVPDGTCIVETDSEILDTSVYDQIKNLSKRLREGNQL